VRTTDVAREGCAGEPHRTQEEYHDPAHSSGPDHEENCVVAGSDSRQTRICVELDQPTKSTFASFGIMPRS
jgi:hypothetical protein